MRRLLFCFIFLLAVTSASATRYDIDAPCRVEAGQNFTTTLTLVDAPAEVGIAYKIPEELRYESYNLTGANLTGNKTGDAYKWTFKPAGEARFETSFYAGTVGNFTYEIYMILPPGQDMVEKKSVEVYEASVKQSPVAEMIVPLPTALVDDKPAVSAGLVNFIVTAFVILWIALQEYSKYRGDKACLSK